MEGELLFLGSGGSTGIPQIGCSCPVCQSSNPKNKRLRPSCLLTIDNKKFIIDIGPDFRHQALKYKITKLDGVLITHSHYDHIGGLDELRIFYLLQKKPVPILLSEASHKEIKFRLHYLFHERKKEHSLPAQLDFHILKEKSGDTQFLGIPIHYATYEQGGTEVNGYRFGKLAYFTDIKNFESTVFEDLKGVDTLIMSALRDSKSPMHLSFEEAFAFAKMVGAKRTILMHIGHEIEYEKATKELPEGFELAYDGMVVTL